MKLLFQTPHAIYRVYEHEIFGYSFHFFKNREGHIIARAPMGDNQKDKLMFDNLVYCHQNIYNGKDKQKVAQKIEEFISNFKSSNK